MVSNNINSISNILTKYLEKQIMSFKTHLIFIFAIFILASCNSNKVKPDSEATTELDIVSSDNGLLVASVTRGMKEGNILTKKDINANFKILQASEIAKLEEEKGKLFTNDNSITISSSVFIVVPIFALWIHYKFVLQEELMLEDKFSIDYLAYKNRVRRWI